MPKPKKKGNAHETAVAKLLTEWAGEPFHRMPTSGALRWHGELWTFGDIVPPEDFHLVIECKHHADVSIDTLFNEKNKICEWWREQAVPDAERCDMSLEINTEPWLVFKRNYGRYRLCLLTDLLKAILEETNSRDLPHLDVTTRLPFYYPFSIVDFKDFLAAVSPDALRTES
jgi:hypothetical protein